MKKGLLLAVVLVSVIFAGSVIYWVADGRPGTPRDFRQRVSETGLDVTWSTSGPRGGVGNVVTECGAIEVAFDEIDGQLWMRWSERREPATQENIEDLVSCNR